MKIVFFPGSFNPFTKGHADILDRLLSLFDRVVIGIGINPDKPESTESAQINEREISDYLSGAGLQERVEVMSYSGLSAEEALKHGACCMARGVRTEADFNYEYSLAAINRDAFGIDTLLLPANPGLGFVSSSAIRELRHFGRADVAEKYLPDKPGQNKL